jgi:hypothetical protein
MNAFSINAAHMYRQRGFSLETFGPGERLAGVLDHIRKELVEIEAHPDDVSEWADLLILGFDGALRQGFHAQEILDAIEAKQCVNEQRVWPDWRAAPEGQAIEHVKDPVVEDPARAYDVDGPYAPTPVEVTAAAVSPVRNKRRGGREPSPESLALNDEIRALLGEGKTQAEIATELNMTSGAVYQRVKKYELRPEVRREALTSAKMVTPPASSAPRPRPVVPRPPSGSRPDVQPRRSVPVVGARRRVQSLFAIGYDHARLNTRLSNTSVLVSQVLADDVTEVPVETFQVIDELWKRLRYQPITPDPTHVMNRAYPPPGIWENIDNPNEQHTVQEPA